jgi:hypothetical protein
MAKEVLSKRIKKENKIRLLKLEEKSKGRITLDKLLEEILPQYETIYYSTNEQLIKTKEELEESEERTQYLKKKYFSLKLKEEEENAKNHMNYDDENTIKALEFMKEDYEEYISHYSYDKLSEDGFNKYFENETFIEFNVMGAYGLKYHKKVFLNGFKEWYLKNHS